MSARLRRRLAELDAQILEKSRVLHKLQQARSDVERELHAIVYPVLTLPAEITTEIFLCCHLLFDPLCISRSKGSAPIVLTTICHAWRDIALATARLWSKLEVRFHDIPAAVISTPGLVEGTIDRWLARAGNCPLSLKFHAGNRNFALSRLRDMIHRWSHRIRYLYIDVGFHDLGLLALDSGAFPLLQGTTIRCDDKPNRTPVVGFRNVPSLHQLCLPLNEFTFAPSATFVFPWLQLTKFEGTIRDFTLFTLAPNLNELICTFKSNHTPPRGITHRSLKSLTVCGMRGLGIFPYLTLPALQYLDVSAIYFPESLRPFLARSSPPLVSLSMIGSPPSLSRWALSMPLVASTLEILEFRDISCNSMVSMLNRHAEMFDPLPNIRTLNFRDVEGAAIASSMVDSVVSFLRARSGTKLHALKIVWGHLFHIDREQLPPFAHIGMDIHIGTAERNYAKRLVSDDLIS
ncbi:hypothetical protein K438DRAFT_1802743 [Mycena galopus ATCC 62051]|nr:hypothetical protein K438DRAFT_1802743 [Mycena galopus ATCC 62051]